MVILAGTFKYLNGPCTWAFKWDPSLGVREGPTCEYLYLMPRYRGIKVLEGTRKWAP